jgi:hypothetical protein
MRFPFQFVCLHGFCIVFTGHETRTALQGCVAEHVLTDRILFPYLFAFPFLFSFLFLFYYYCFAFFSVVYEAACFPL